MDNKNHIRKALKLYMIFSYGLISLEELEKGMAFIYRTMEFKHYELMAKNFIKYLELEKE